MLMKKQLIIISALVALYSCSDSKEDDEVYPDIVTELADVTTDNQGRMTRMTLDNGTSYQISNPQEGYAKKAMYRVACSYVPSGSSAELYQVEGVHYLRDSSTVAIKDPTPVVSAWRAGKYINLQLAPLTQGGPQYWGFIIDKVDPGHAYVSLHHRQNGDPMSYTQTSYASLPVDSLKDIVAGDKITLSIATPKGEQTWEFQK